MGRKKGIDNSLAPMITPEEKKRIKAISEEAAKHYEQVIRDIKNSGNTKVRFAAYVIYDSTYGMDGTVKLMLQDKNYWDVKVVIIPDVLRGEVHAKNTYEKTKKYFVEKYGEEYVIDGYNSEKDEYYDLLDQFDIVYYANPYDCMVHKYHSIEYASHKNVLPIYVSYGYDVGQYTTLGRLYGPELNLVWKCFADTRYSLKDFKKYQVNRGKNVVLAGYSKMDELAKIEEKKREKKKILITPHHTIDCDILPLSNFQYYSDLILELPKMYPGIEFVFRPHPLLFTNLVNSKKWSEKQVEEYLKKLNELGVEYSNEGDYMHLYRECDAIINDCGSFTVEWLYTGKKGCFVYNKDLSEDKITRLMRKAISCYDIARSREDIISFVDKIANDKNNAKIKSRFWIKRNIFLGFPNVSKKILDELSIIER